MTCHRLALTLAVGLLLVGCPERVGPLPGATAAPTVATGRSRPPDVASARHDAPPPGGDTPPGVSGEAPRPPPPPRRPATAPSAPPPAPPTATASARPRSEHHQECDPADPGLKPLEVTKFQLTSNVKDKRPVDEITTVVAGERTWAYLIVKNLSGTERCVTVTFRVSGRKRSSHTLKIGQSPSWRTWAYNTASKADIGKELQVEVVDDHGNLRGDKSATIAATRN